MATIDELDFKVILHDEDFNKKVEASIKRAEKLNTQLSKLLEIERKVGKAQITGAKDVIESEKALKAMAQRKNEEAKTAITMEKLSITTMKRQQTERSIAEDLARQASGMKDVAKGADDAAKAHGKSRTNVESTNRSLAHSSNILRQLSTMAGAYFSVQGARRFLSSLIDITGQFEVQKMALTSMLQSGEMADKIFNQYRQLALESPYTFQDFTKFGKQLTAFNIPAQELVGTTKMLADVSAGLGVDMGRVILAYGQIKSAGVLKGTELRQLTEAGVPILDSLAKQIEETTGKTVKLAEVFSMISKKQIPFEMVEQAFKDMTSEGGKFYNMQEVLVETLKGKIGKLRDTWQQTLYDFGEGDTVNSLLKGGVDALTNALGNLGKTIAEIIGIFGTYKIALFLTEAAAAGLTAAEIAQSAAAATLGKVTKALNAALLKNPYVALAAMLTTFGYTIYKIVDGIKGMNEMQREIQATQSSYNAEVTKGLSELDRLYTRLKLAKEGTDEYNSAIKAIQGRYSDYITQLRNEGVEVGNLATVYDDLRIKIEQAARARFVEAARSGIDKTYAEGIKGIMEGINGDDIFNVKRAAKELRLTPAEEKALAMLVGGFTTKEAIAKDLDIAGLLAKMKKGRVSLGPGSSGPMNAEKYIDVLINKVNNLKADFEAASDTIDKFAEDLPTTITEDPTKPPTPTDPTTTKEENEIKKRISNLQKLKDDYDKFVQHPLIGEDGAKSLMKLIFNDDDIDYVSRIETELEKLLKLNPELQEYADGILASFGKDKSDMFLKLVSAFEKLKDARDKYDAKDFRSEGTGALFDIVSAAKDGMTKLNEADLKHKENLELLAKVQAGDKEALALLQQHLDKETWEKYVTQGESAFDELRDKEKAWIVASMNDRIAALARSYAKESVEDYDMTDLRHKSRSQLSWLYDEISGKRDDIWKKLLQNEELQDVVKMNGISLEEARNAFDRFFDKILKNIADEKAKKLIKGVQGMFKAFAGFGSVFKEIGEKTGNSGLSTFGDILDITQELASALAENEKLFESLFSNSAGKVEEAAEDMGELADETGKTAETAGKLADTADIITLVFKVAMIVVQRVADAIGESYEAQRLLNKAERDYLEALREVARMKHDGYFGEDAIGLLATNWDNATQAAEKYRKTLEKDTGKTGYNFWAQKKIGNISDLAKIYPGIFDADGNLDMEYIKAYKEVFEKGRNALSGGRVWKMSADLKLLIEELIEDYDAMVKETDAFAQSMKSIFGNLADTIADGMVDAFIETGDALGNLEKGFEDFGESVARTMLKSMLSAKMMEQFDGRLNALAESYMKELGTGSRESADMKFAQMLAGLAGEMRDFAEGYGDFANSFLSSMQQAGLLGSGEGSETLASGIKGITEDTANLLASYLNAVRADVAGIRAMNATGWKDVNSILGLLGNTPTLNDYLAQVAATNFDIAQTNRQMLAEIQGVITSSSGRRAIAVDVQ